MKILLTVPDAADYHAVHQHLAQQLGQGCPNPFQLPITIERADCASHPSNYTVLTVDHSGDGDSWSVMALLKFRHRPYVKPPAPPIDDEEENRIDTEADKAWQQQTEDEDQAIFQALADAGHHFRATTPESAYSPTGRHYSCAPDIRLFEEHVLVTQSGGLDC